LKIASFGGENRQLKEFGCRFLVFGAGRIQREDVKELLIFTAE
jgi:hypothetical protein